MKKTLVLSLFVVLVLTAPLLAQGPPPLQAAGQQGGPQAGPTPEVVLKDALGLTDDQVTALKGLLDTRRQNAETLRTQLADAEKALADALAATSPDPTQVGTLLLAVQAVRTKLDKVDEAFRTGFTALLTSDQQQKVSAILSLQKSLQAGQALRQLGL